MSSPRTRSLSSTVVEVGEEGDLARARDRRGRSLDSFFRSSGHAASPSSTSPRMRDERERRVWPLRLRSRSIIGPSARRPASSRRRRAGRRAAARARACIADVNSDSVGARSGDWKRTTMVVSSRRPEIASTTPCARSASTPVMAAPPRRPPRTRRSTDSARKRADAQQRQPGSPMDEGSDGRVHRFSSVEDEAGG